MFSFFQWTVNGDNGADGHLARRHVEGELRFQEGGFGITSKRVEEACHAVPVNTDANNKTSPVKTKYHYLTHSHLFCTKMIKNQIKKDYSSFSVVFLPPNKVYTFLLCPLLVLLLGIFFLFLHAPHHQCIPIHD